VPTTSTDHKTTQITAGTTGTRGRTRRVTGAAAGPMFTDSQASDLSVQLVARGPQDTVVRTGQDAAGRHVTVTVGRTLVYTYDTDTDTVALTGEHSWRHVDPATARYLQFLTEAGYTPSPVERLAGGHQPTTGEVG